MARAALSAKRYDSAMVASKHAVNAAIPHKEAEQVNPGRRLPLREQSSSRDLCNWLVSTTRLLEAVLESVVLRFASSLCLDRR